MTAPDDARRVAAALTPEQRAAMLGRFQWAGSIEQDDGERELYRLGLWGPHGGNSPLGLAVCAILIAEDAALTDTGAV